jgi:radical SAM protein with 4Fe4S-binding SPASM domain
MQNSKIEEKNAYRRLMEKAWNQCIPVSAHFELTFRCNHDCVFCYNTREDESGKKELTLSDYKESFKKLKELDILFVTLTGGEPLSRKDFFEIAEAAKTEGYALRIFSNGYLIDREMARRLKALKPFEVEMSIHGDNAETHEKMTQIKGSFRKLMEAVDFLKELGVKINLKSVITKFNQEQLSGIRDIAYKKGCSITFDPVVSPKDDGTKGPLQFSADKEHLQKFWTEIYPDLRNSVLAPVVEDDCVWAVCGIGRTSLTIDPYGDIFPCIQWREKVANIKEVTSMKDLWENDAVFKTVREMAMKVKERVLDKLEFGHFCHYCPAMAEMCMGDPFTIYPQAIENARNLSLAYKKAKNQNYEKKG